MMDPEAVLLYESQIFILAKQVQDNQCTKLGVILVITLDSKDTFFFFSKEKWMLFFNFG